MTQAAPANYVWWLAGRSAGLVAMLLVTALGDPRPGDGRARDPAHAGGATRCALHQHLALIALGAIAAHGLLLAADPWLKAGAKGILVPFAIGYRPLWTGLGIIGGYLAAILGLSFYVRRRIGARLWRRMHRFTVVVYVLALAHALGSGTDASIPVVRYAMLASTLPVLFLFALRLQRGRARGRRAHQRRGQCTRAARGSPDPEPPKPRAGDEQAGHVDRACPADETKPLAGRLSSKGDDEMSYIPSIDQSSCIAQGDCVELVPDVFQSTTSRRSSAPDPTTCSSPPPRRAPSKRSRIVDSETGAQVFP